MFESTGEYVRTYLPFKKFCSTLLHQDFNVASMFWLRVCTTVLILSPSGQKWHSTPTTDHPARTLWCLLWWRQERMHVCTLSILVMYFWGVQLYIFFLTAARGPRPTTASPYCRPARAAGPVTNRKQPTDVHWSATHPRAAEDCSPSAPARQTAARLPKTHDTQINIRNSNQGQMGSKLLLPSIGGNVCEMFDCNTKERTFTSLCWKKRWCNTWPCVPDFGGNGLQPQNYVYQK